MFNSTNSTKEGRYHVHHNARTQYEELKCEVISLSLYDRKVNYSLVCEIHLYLSNIYRMDFC